MKRLVVDNKFKTNKVGLQMGYIIISFLISILTMQVLTLFKLMLILDIKMSDVLYIGEAILIIGTILTVIGGMDFLKDNLFREESILKGIGIGTISGLGIMFITYLYRIIPVFIGKRVIAIGSNQAVSTYKDFSFESLLVTSITPAILEEFVFRVGGFTICAVIFRFIFQQIRKDKKSLIEINVLNLRSRYGLMALIFTSLIFAIMHGPSILSLPIYLLPGLLFGFLYCKYGLGVSIVSHCMSNYLSSLILTLVVFLINLLV